MCIVLGLKQRMKELVYTYVNLIVVNHAKHTMTRVSCWYAGSVYLSPLAGTNNMHSSQPCMHENATMAY